MFKAHIDKNKEKNLFYIETGEKKKKNKRFEKHNKIKTNVLLIKHNKLI